MAPEHQAPNPLAKLDARTSGIAEIILRYHLLSILQESVTQDYWVRGAEEVIAFLEASDG